MRGGSGGSEAATATAGPRVASVEAAAEDAFGLDPEFRDTISPIFRFLHDRYWRVEVRGAENVPRGGPVVFIANHSGALPFDGAMIVTAVNEHCGRTLRFLYDRFVTGMGPVDSFYRKVGGVPATKENAVALLEAGDPLLLFPEGVSGVAKTFSERYRLRPFSPGFARIALALDVPIVPVAVVGAEEIYPMVGRAEGLGKVIGAPYLPITPFFPVLGFLGALPLPTKWTMRFGKPIRLGAVEEEARGTRAKAEATRIRRQLQAMVTRLKQRRQSVFFG